MSVLVTDTFAGLVQVRHIRSANPMGFGGCIFAGYHIDAQGKQLNTPYIAVAASNKLLPLGGQSVTEWDCWYVAGASSVHITKEDGFVHKELRVDASELYMVLPNGEMLFKYLAESPKFRGTGVGPVKIRRLLTRYNQDLPAILDTGDFDKLTVDDILSPESAVKLIKVWKEHAPGRFISFLQSNQFPPQLATRAINYYGQEAEKKLHDDPYCLLWFGAKWKDVDKLAQKTFRINSDDERRLVGAVDAVLAKQFIGKHTATPEKIVKEELAKLLNIDGDKSRTSQLVASALEVGNCNGTFIKTQNGKLYHRLGTIIMEKLIADRIAKMIREPDVSANIFMTGLTTIRIEELIYQFEQNERRKPGKELFTINNEQRLAVNKSLLNRFSVITGGAGTGKTTALNYLYYILEALGYSVIQMALCGKAVKRMNDTTGRKARTIAGFLRKARELFDEHGENTYVVIDEASMLDLQTTFRIFRVLPDHVRIVLVGDPHQLPPIGPGLIFQVLVGMHGVPQEELKIVKRQADRTGIPQFAFDIRNHRWKTPICSGVHFVSCNNMDLKAKTLELFAANGPDNTQILCAVKKCAMSGVEEINRECQRLHNSTGRPIRVLDMNGNLCPVQFREGDRIIFLNNDWVRGTMNGSIATITKAFDQVKGEDNPVLGTALLESDKSEEEYVSLYLSDLDYHDPGIMLGYATTGHKAQGSQWPRVIIPIKKNKFSRSIIMDCTWIYTAVTRGEKEVIIVGDEETIERIVISPPKVHDRCVGFGKILESFLNVAST